MKNIELSTLSSSYVVKKLEKKDVPLLYDLCKENPQYYQYTSKPLTIELVESDLVTGLPDSYRSRDIMSVLGMMKLLLLLWIF